MDSEFGYEQNARVSRREALLLGAAGAVTIASKPAMARASGGADRWRDTIIVNALGGLSNPNRRGEPSPQGRRQPVEPRVIADARASGMTAVNITLGYVAGDADPFEESVSEIAAWDWIIRNQSSDLAKITSVADIKKAKADRKIGLIYGFQNAAMVGDKPERVDIFADLGVKIIQLTYNPSNQIGDGSMAPGNRGLTPLGHKVMERLHENRIMVDLSHSGERTCLDAARASTRPISINHTGCRALTDLPRNKTDEELRLVASRGGFVGIYFMPFLNLSGHAAPDDVVAHIEHAIKICGEDHVGIGTDGGTTSIDDMDAFRQSLAREVERRRASGIGATGERPDTLPFVPGLDGVDQFFKLAALLEKRGHSQSRIEKILGGNFLRFASDIWG